MGTIQKKSSKNSVFIAVWRNLIIIYIFIFKSVKQNKCARMLYCDIITIKEDCCWLFFLNWVLSLILFCIQSINRQLLAAKRWHRSNIVFLIMQHSDCNSPLADMLNPFNNVSMDFSSINHVVTKSFYWLCLWCYILKKNSRHTRVLILLL